MDLETIIKQIESTGSAIDFVDNENFRNSMSWYLKKVNLTQTKPTYDFTDRYMDRTMLGNMYMFMYVPKNKQILNYYDQFPLVLPIQTKNKSTNHFFGLNFHYLPTKQRLFFFDKLKKFQNTDKYKESKIIMTYEFLKSSGFLKEYKATIKKYNLNSVQSKFVYIKPEEWETAILLPSYKFIGENVSKIWQDSGEIIK
jgi:hypothetical protein